MLKPLDPKPGTEELGLGLGFVRGIGLGMGIGLFLFLGLGLLGMGLTLLGLKFGTSDETHIQSEYLYS